MKKLFFVVFLIIQVFANEIVVKYPRTSNEVSRYKFQIDMLAFILDKANVKYKFQPTKKIYTQARILKELKNGKLDISWMGTSPKMEKEFITIYYPLYRGLLGHRIFIINKKKQKIFNNVNSLKDLQKLTGIQGIGWSDIKILEYSGLKQKTAKYENIFAIVNKGRVDYFSRGLNEAYVEVEARKNKYKNITVEKHVVLIYPFAMFFFVSPKNPELAKLINKGFKKAYEDGSFVKWFYNYPDIKKSLNQAHLDKRVKIKIPNPFITDKVKNIDKRYWHND